MTPTTTEYLTPEQISAGMPGQFCATSLVAWLAVADLARVPSIPARQIGTISQDLQCRVLDDPETAVLTADEIAELRRITEGVRPGEIRRVDCCAGGALKYHMAQGSYPLIPPQDPSWLDDPRLFEILGDDRRPQVPVLARPWRTDFAVATGTKGGIYPVEWRVFIGGHADDLAVSAYYPQAPLGNEWLAFAELAQSMASQMLRTMRTTKLAPWLPIYRDAPPGIHCTLDFVTLAGGGRHGATTFSLAFLEGGPPHLETWGAHPCCFEGRRPSGVALRAEPVGAP